MNIRKRDTYRMPYVTQEDIDRGANDVAYQLSLSEYMENSQFLREAINRLYKEKDKGGWSDLKADQLKLYTNRLESVVNKWQVARGNRVRQTLALANKLLK